MKRKEYKPLLPKLKKFIKENKTWSIPQVAKHFSISLSTLERLQRNYGIWEPRKNKKISPMVKALVFESLKETNFIIPEAFYVFTEKINRLDSESKKELELDKFPTRGAFYHWAKQLKENPKKNYSSLKVFKSNDFKAIFKKHPDRMDSPTFQLSFKKLLETKQTENFFLDLDPQLSPDHLLRYMKIKSKGCWTCGKTNHFGASFKGEIDHIEGDTSDNRLSRLRLLCPCCHQYTITKSPNKGFTKRKMQRNSNASALYRNFEESVDLKMMQESFLKFLHALEDCERNEKKDMI